MKIRSHVIFCFSLFYIKMVINFEVVLDVCWTLCCADVVYFFKGCFQESSSATSPCELRSRECTLRAWWSRSLFLPDTQESQQPLADVSFGEYAPFALSLSQKKTHSSVTRNKGRCVCCAVHQSCRLLNPKQATCSTHSIFAPCAEPSLPKGCCWLKVALLPELWMCHRCRQCSWRICLVKLSSQFDLIYVMHLSFLKISK